MQKRTSPYPLLLMALGGLLLSLAVFLLVNRSPRPIQTPEATLSVQDEGSVPRVSVKDAKAAFDAGTAVFLDVRGADAYALGHIQGALSIPLAEVESRLKELNPDQWIIPYCTWPAEESSARAAVTLLQNGFKKVTPILGGFNAWEQAGYPVEK